MSIELLKGEVLLKVTSDEKGNDVIKNNSGYAELYFHTLSGRKFKMHHYQDCCEYVDLEDIDSPEVLCGAVIDAEEVTEDDGSAEDAMWTFYKISVAHRGSCTLRWYGSSNGFYSIAVYFEEITYGQEN